MYLFLELEIFNGYFDLAKLPHLNFKGGFRALRARQTRGLRPVNMFRVFRKGGFPLSRRYPKLSLDPRPLHLTALAEAGKSTAPTEKGATGAAQHVERTSSPLS